jgi:hypothetical protein
MTLIDPRYFMRDPEAQPFLSDYRVDLAAPDVPLESGTQYTTSARYIVTQIRPPKGQTLLIKAFQPYAMKRTNIDADDESFALIDPLEAAGHFNFEPLVGGLAPIVAQLNVNAPRELAVPPVLLNSDRVVGKGVSFISSTPYADVMRSGFNQNFTIEVPSDRLFTVVFSIIDGTAFASPLPIGGQFQVTTDPAVTKRVDFAGVVVSGIIMSDQRFQQLTKEIASRGVY